MKSVLTEIAFCWQSPSQDLGPSAVAHPGLANCESSLRVRDIFVEPPGWKHHTSSVADGILTPFFIALCKTLLLFTCDLYSSRGPEVDIIKTDLEC